MSVFMAEERTNVAEKISLRMTNGVQAHQGGTEKNQRFATAVGADGALPSRANASVYE
jgi:hypothetical protein